MKRVPDLTNIAYTNDYLAHREKVITAAFHSCNKMKTEEIQEQGCKRVVEEYRVHQEDKTFFCARNLVFDERGEQIHEYINLYSHPFFCKHIEHINGKSYLFYKEDLYGYSVYDLMAKKTFSYYPAHSWNGSNGGETFIGTHIHYNPQNNIIAVEGCYWACSGEVFLFHITDPMCQFDAYLSIHMLLDEDYEKYDDISFGRWDGTDIELKCYDIQTKPYKTIEIRLSEGEYKSYVSNY